MENDPVIGMPHGGILYINPGSGATDANEEEATKNIEFLIKDVNLPGISSVRCPDKDYHKEYGSGRLAYELKLGQRTVEVQMPGVPIDKVRYDKDKQDAFDFPRLYVDGSSWWWEFAISIVKDRLEHKDTE